MTDFKLTELVILRNLLDKRISDLKQNLKDYPKIFKKSESVLKDMQDLYYKILEKITEIDER